MRLSRRDILRIGGLALAGLPFRGAAALGAEPLTIEMRGNKEGSVVWFEPIGILIRPGATLRWVNRDKGNAHTTTAYHPDNDGHPLRLPAGVPSWDSGYLLPDKGFSLTLTRSGVYDYFCIPHEHAGMVGRIVVAGEGEAVSAPVGPSPIEELPDPFPPVDEIVRQGLVLRKS